MVCDVQRQEQAAAAQSAGSLEAIADMAGGEHLGYVYKDRGIVEDVTNLVVHHLKRQASIQKEDKHKMKQLMYHFLPQLFHLPLGELSDDEGAGDEGNT